MSAPPDVTATIRIHFNEETRGLDFNAADLPFTGTADLLLSNNLQTWNPAGKIAIDDNGRAALSNISPVAVGLAHTDKVFAKLSFDHRKMRMGFTNWPPSYSLREVSQNKDFINRNGDVGGIHMQKIPYAAAALSNKFDDYPQYVKDEIIFQMEGLANQDYLALDSLNTLRTGPAEHWLDPEKDSISSEWQKISFSSDPNDTAFFDAYINYASMLIDVIQPKYFNFATEASDLMFSNPDAFDSYGDFWIKTYATLKNKYPDITFMASIVLNSPNSEKMQVTKSLMNIMQDSVDAYGVSCHPFFTFDHADKGNPDNLPTNWFSQLQNNEPLPSGVSAEGHVFLQLSKPLSITETSWPAEDIPGLSIASDPEKQKRFIEKLLYETNQHDIGFILLFTGSDFDGLNFPDFDLDNPLIGLGSIWRDTGLQEFNSNGHPPSKRPALKVWQNTLNAQFTPDAP